jgi:hypothetical protein
MRSHSIHALVVVALLALPAATGRPDDPKPAADNKLLGTWKLVSAKYGGREYKYPEGSMTLKHVTPTQFMWATYDKDGRVTRTSGGGYTLKGEVYEEVPRYGLGSDFLIIKGKAQAFRWKVEGNKWFHTGQLSNAQTVDEVWERDEPK